MKVLIGFSRCPITVTLLRFQGIEAWTCDLLPAEHSFHIQGDVWEQVNKRWDWGIFHPMCTYLTCSAAWAFNDPDFKKYPDVGYHQKLKHGTLTGSARRLAREQSLEDFRKLLALSYPKMIENPAVSFINNSIRKPDQVIQPYEFGDDASKSTGLWIDRMQKLVAEPGQRFNGRIVTHNGKMVERWSNQTNSGQNKLTPSDERWLDRSKTYPGIAIALSKTRPL